MFILKNSEGPLHFWFQQAFHHRHHHRSHNLLMAYLLGHDPCSHLSKPFSDHEYLSSSNRGCSNGCYQSFPFLSNLIYANGFRANRNIGFSIKGCFDSSSSISSNRNKIFVKARTKPREYAPLPRPPFLADMEQGLSVRDDGRDATLTHVDNGSLNGIPIKTFSFHDHHLCQKLVVAVDVDEVLGNFVSALNKFIADRYSSNYSVSDYHVYEFFKIWNCSRAEADIRVHEFFKTPYFKSGIHPLPGAQMALKKLSRFCNLSVVTSRQNAIKHHTIEWLDRNYRGLFHEIHFGNHFALDGVSRPKSEICRSLNAKVLIDDNPRYAIECAEVGIRVLLFDYENSYPWCKADSVDQHPLVTKVKNWEEIEQKLMSLIGS